MKFFRFEDYEPKQVVDRSAYQHKYYLARRESIRKKPIMNEEEKRQAHNEAQKRYSKKLKTVHAYPAY